MQTAQLKEQLRQKYKEIRTNLTGEQRLALGNEIYRNLFNFTEYRSAKLVLTYYSTKFEPETRVIRINRNHAGRNIAFPRFDREGMMEFYYTTCFGDFEEGDYGIRVPKSDCRKVEDFDNSVCIVPGLAFDKQGYRLGYGKGYYDRFLQNYNGFKIGLCYSECMAESLPREQHDIAVDVVVTDKIDE
ncbi:MAG: 5-formyltetrahydrofolate cyclo-ligase [Oscillospiraceae bacterium]|nr:5-formyltetrahydrofolate cyclo-ligase [Oscillospiraceae bacterium]